MSLNLISVRRLAHHAWLGVLGDNSRTDWRGYKWEEVESGHESVRRRAFWRLFNSRRHVTSFALGMPPSIIVVAAKHHLLLFPFHSNQNTFDFCKEIPSSLSMEEGAGFLVTWLTAAYAVWELAHPRAGQVEQPLFFFVSYSLPHLPLHPTQDTDSSGSLCIGWGWVMSCTALQA